MSKLKRPEPTLYMSDKKTAETTTSTSHNKRGKRGVGYEVEEPIKVFCRFRPSFIGDNSIGNLFIHSTPSPSICLTLHVHTDV
jgi:hypothetical protein